MNPTAFMVGDYANINGTSCRIDAVHQKKVGYHTIPYKLSWARAEKIQPIPLTKEILEKNGWQHIPCDDVAIYKDSRGIIVLCHPSGFMLKVKTIEGIDLDLPICYVHELQQALRLCGIN